MLTGFCNEHRCVGINAESGIFGCNGVCDYHVSILHKQFFTAVFEQVFGFHRKTDNNLAGGFGSSDACENILRAFEHETGLMSKEELAKVILEKAAELL